MMAGYFALTGQIVSDAGGRLIKTLGDAGLVAFPAEAADGGVLALRPVQTAGREWLAKHGEIIDVYGKTVNVAAALPSTGLAVTPAVFRSLQAESRKHQVTRRGDLGDRSGARLVAGHSQRQGLPGRRPGGPRAIPIVSRRFSPLPFPAELRSL